MRPTPLLFAALALMAALAGCGTKTPLTLPPPQPPAKSATQTPPPEGLPLLAQAEAPYGLSTGASR